MIIWGSKGKANTVGRGHFYCPRCKTNRSYEHKQLGKYFTLYFVPLFKTKDLAEYVECTVCRTPYEPEVLDFDPQNQSAIRSFLQMVRDEIEAGVPLHSIYQGLIDNGASEEIANTVIATTTGGKMKQCPECKLVYADALRFCSNCGSALAEMGK